MRAMCGVQLEGKKRVTDLKLGFSEAVDPLAMAMSCTGVGMC